MAEPVILPKLGLTMQEGVVTEWVAKPGDVVRPGDVLMRIGTDKVDVDVEAEAAGRFEPIVEEGAVLPPGAIVGWLLTDGESVPASSGGPAGEIAPPAARDVDELSLPAQPAAPPTPSPSEQRLKSSPNARRVARERNVDLTLVRGTGPGGRITSEDVEAALAAPAAEPAAAAATPAASAAVPPAPAERAAGAVSHLSPLVRREAQRRGLDLGALRGTGVGGRVRRADLEQVPATVPAAEPTFRPGQVIPLSGMRGAIARNMHASLQEMAQLTHGYEADVTALVTLRAGLKREWADTGLRVPSVNDFVMRAVTLALAEHPLLNATVRDNAVHLLEDVHLGFAVALPDGLVVPVVRDAAHRGLAELAQETAELAGSARDGRLRLDQMEGATFVVTALGSYGVDFFTPVVNPGNVAILGVGRIRDGVAWAEDVPRRTRVLTLSLSFDHRAVDGAPAADFLRTVSALLGRPLLLLAG